MSCLIGVLTCLGQVKPEPAGNSRRFLILDFWENDFNRVPNPEQAQSLPVLVRLFNTRLALMERTLDDQSSPEARRTIADLRAMVARIPTDSLLVRRVYPEVEEAWRESWWFYLNASKLEFLLLKVGPLLAMRRTWTWRRPPSPTRSSG